MKIKKLIFLDISQQLMCYKGTQHKETEFSGFYRNYITKKIVFFLFIELSKLQKNAYHCNVTFISILMNYLVF